MHTHRLQRILSTVRSTTQLHFCNLNVSKNLMSKDLLQQLNLHCMCFWMSINKSSFIIFCWVNTYIRLETAFPTGFPFATAQQQLPDCLENCESIFSNIYPGADVSGVGAVCPSFHRGEERETSAALASVAQRILPDSSRRLQSYQVLVLGNGYLGDTQRGLGGLEPFLWKLLFGIHPVDFPTGPCCCLDCMME